MSKLIPHIRRLVPDQLISETSAATGENTQSVPMAYNQLIPCILHAILNLQPHKQAAFISLVHKTGALLPDQVNLTQLMTAEALNPYIHCGNDLISIIFGEKRNGVAQLIARTALMKPESADIILKILASIVTLCLSLETKLHQWQWTSIHEYIMQSEKAILEQLPEGFLTLMSTEHKPVSDKMSVKQLIMSHENTSQGKKWMVPLILAGLFGIGIWYWSMGCNSPKNETSNAQSTLDSAGASISSAADQAAAALSAKPDSSQGYVDADGNWILPSTEKTTLKLDNGVEMIVTKGSLEDRLYNFIKDPGSVAGKDMWFEFTDLRFKANKSVLSQDTCAQITHLITLLQAYPTMKIKIGAYTDNTGDSLANMKLSEKRAKFVYDQLIKGGVARSSFDVKPYEGYGSTEPLSDNTTAEGRAQNRRVAVNVRSK
ncbi:MAG: OmpA family protein [Chitinophagaceae bacterium]|nr:OmpA family protein [Chitinophagaceae bacterium]